MYTSLFHLSISRTPTYILRALFKELQIDFLELGFIYLFLSLVWFGL